MSGSLIDLVASTTTVTTRPVQIDFESSLANYNSEDAESIWDTRFLVENIPVDARIGIEYVESAYIVTVDLNSGQKPMREFLELLTGIIMFLGPKVHLHIFLKVGFGLTTGIPFLH